MHLAVKSVAWPAHRALTRPACQWVAWAHLAVRCQGVLACLGGKWRAWVAHRWGKCLGVWVHPLDKWVGWAHPEGNQCLVAWAHPVVKWAAWA